MKLLTNKKQSEIYRLIGNVQFAVLMCVDDPEAITGISEYLAEIACEIGGEEAGDIVLGHVGEAIKNMKEYLKSEKEEQEERDE